MHSNRLPGSKYVHCLHECNSNPHFGHCPVAVIPCNTVPHCAHRETARVPGRFTGRGPNVLSRFGGRRAQTFPRFSARPLPLAHGPDPDTHAADISPQTLPQARGRYCLPARLRPASSPIQVALSFSAYLRGISPRPVAVKSFSLAIADSPRVLQYPHDPRNPPRRPAAMQLLHHRRRDHPRSHGHRPRRRHRRHPRRDPRNTICKSNKSSSPTPTSTTSAEP